MNSKIYRTTLNIDFMEIFLFLIFFGSFYHILKNNIEMNVSPVDFTKNADKKCMFYLMLDWMKSSIDW